MELTPGELEILHDVFNRLQNCGLACEQIVERPEAMLMNQTRAQNIGKQLTFIARQLRILHRIPAVSQPDSGLHVGHSEERSGKAD
jgi:hypothetical protein